MAVPSLPAQGSSSWFGWAQGLHNEVTTGRLSDTALGKVAAPTGTAATDTAAFQSQLSAASSAGGGIVFFAGQYSVNARLTVPDGVSLRGDGKTSKILCTTAGAGVTVSGTGSGGFAADFTVDGNAVATNPMLCTGLNAARTISGVTVLNAAQDNWIFETCQNYAVIGCNSQGAARDNLVLDKSTGGHLFSRFESNGAGRHALEITQANPASDYGTGGYFAPTHIKFDHCIFERGTANASAVQMDYGLNVVFADCVTHGAFAGATSPLMVLASGTTATLTDPIFSGLSTQTAAIQIGASAGLFMDGRGSFVGPAAAFDIASGGLLDLRGSVSLGGGTVMYTAATDRNVRVRSVKRGAETLQRQASTDVVFDVIVDGETGARARFTADGVWQFGDGSNFSFGSALFRRGDGHFGTSTGLVVGGPFAANGAAPVGKAANPGTATGTDATVINAVVTALRNVGIVT